jgi:hypothetical protein
MGEKSNLKAPYTKKCVIYTSFLSFSGIFLGKTPYFMAFHKSKERSFV